MLTFLPFSNTVLKQFMSYFEISDEDRFYYWKCDIHNGNLICLLLIILLVITSGNIITTNKIKTLSKFHGCLTLLHFSMFLENEIRLTKMIPVLCDLHYSVTRLCKMCGPGICGFLSYTISGN